MPSFGEKLKLEREKRKITLEQISSSTKISTRMLHALEEEKFNQLPGGIFNKGFVRAYARTLGLDEEQTIAEYLEAAGEAPPRRADSDARDISREHAARTAPLRITDEGSGRLEIRAEVASRQLPWGMFAVGLLIVALGLSLWNYRRLERERNPPPANQAKTSQSAAQAAPPGPAASGTEVAPAPAEQNAAAAPNATTPPQTSATQPATPSGQPASSAPSSAVRSSVAPSSATPSPLIQSSTAPSQVGAKLGGAAATPPVPGEFVVAIQARDESWISAVVDGKAVGSETIDAGAARAYHAQKLVTIRTGNVGALDFRLNGKTLPVGGDFGEVRTITIGPAGLVPTPSSPVP